MNKEQAIQELKEWKEESGVSRDKAIDVYSQFKNSPSLRGISFTVNNKTYNVSRREFWDYINTSDIRNVYKLNVEDHIEECLKGNISDEDMVTYNAKLRKARLKISDKLNYERKMFNKDLRQVSVLEELNQELIKQLREIPTRCRQYELPYGENSGVGFICLSDIHANELIDIPSNHYDFEVLSKRLKKLADKSIKFFNSKGVKRLCLLGLGDFLNSDRRKSEILNMATNRSKAVVLLYYILKQFIEDLQEEFDLIVKFQVGNESRVFDDNFDTSDMLATYNYDFTLFQMLKIGFENNKNIKFIDGDWNEAVLKICNSNVLITHGTFIGNDVEKAVAQTFGRFANNGINLDYMLFGHKHSARISDLYSRSSSLCGGNSYSEGALNLISRASQIIGVFYEDKSHDIINIDLQDVNNINGYDIVEKLQEYNVKSSDKKQRYLIHNILN